VFPDCLHRNLSSGSQQQSMANIHEAV